MGEYGPGTYGDRMAEVYDDLNAWMLDTESAVEALAGLAGDGPVLELGVGTGRLALPLVARGLEVHGIDASEQMVAKLREKREGERITVAMGDFAEVPAPGGPYSMVFVAFNTIFGLLTQDDQVRCFRGVADHLAEDGVFVLEAFVPDLARFDRGQRVDARVVEVDRVQIEVSRHDPANQRIDSQLILGTGGKLRLFPVRIRYMWPSEMDLMARLAGLELRHRWGGWRKEPFAADSTRHISIYARA